MAAPLPSWPNLQVGNSGKNVYALQFLLMFKNFSAPANGTFDTQTETAVRAFQTRNNLPSDGIAGKDTLSRLIYPVKQTVKQYPARAAQYLLSKFQSLTVDGDFGSGSANALAAFQVRMRIPITGIADSLTWQYMFGYNSYPLAEVPLPSSVAYASVCAGTTSTLSTAQMDKNAKYVYDFLIGSGFTKQAACGVLGNMQQESKINPGIWEILPSTINGYGLVQWTDATKFLNWAVSNGTLRNALPETVNALTVRDPVQLMQAELNCLIWGCESGTEYLKPEVAHYENHTGYSLTFNEYKTSKLDAGTLAIVFNDHFERSNDNPGLEKRRQFALNWYHRL